ncbi:MAG TPA: N-acetylmuramoyl-L-alanine amidase [Spirochaetia bacterium]|nr:N-acetylmuramoyl-L-alanine amidase [Spirochaetia bacterium]
MNVRVHKVFVVWVSVGLTGLLFSLSFVLNLWSLENGQAVKASTRTDRQPKPVVTAIQPLTGPWVVAVQPGHWEVAALPDELYRLRTSTGAQYGSVREVDINRSVAAALVPMIRARGWTPLLVPATVPPDLRADAFIALHADWGDQSDRRGWKLTPPWRASGASRKLAAAMSAAFSAEPNLVQDVDGVSVNMRGYYAFNNRRFTHAASPYTPDLIIEMGFITNPSDRRLLTTSPEFYAAIIMRGLEHYFASRTRTETDDLRPLELPWVAAGSTGAAVRQGPSPESPVRWRLDPGTVMMPVDQSGDWYEVFVRHQFATGWISKDDTVPAEDPRWPMPGENQSLPRGLPVTDR